MAFLGGTFDANSVEPSAPIEILPPGKYPVQIIKSEMRDTRSGSGQMLALELEVVDGPSKGRKLWDNLNLVNSNTQAQEIAQRTLSAICHAIGKLQVSDSDELHFKPILATVIAKPAGHKEKNGYVLEKGKNEITGYSALGGGTASTTPRPTTQAPPPAARQAAPAGGSNPPWRRAG